MNPNSYESFKRFNDFRRQLKPVGTETVLLPDRRVVRVFLATHPDCRNSVEDISGISIYWELDRKGWDQVVKNVDSSGGDKLMHATM